MTTRIATAESVPEIRRCFPVMHELRPTHNCETFLAQVQRQAREVGYRLAYVEEGGEVKAVAGFRVSEFLAWGKTLYVDDLVTRSTERSRGYGDQLFDWLVAQARAQGCAQFHLDSGVHRFGAHRFYLRKRMDIAAHHFALKLTED